MKVPLWTPSPERIERAPLTEFARAASRASGLDLSDYDALHAWSLNDLDRFWNLVWDWTGVVGVKGATVLADGDSMRKARFFPDAHLNFAENLLAGGKGRRDRDALVFRAEDKACSRLTWDELRARVARLQQFLLDQGVKPGDRVAAVMPNMPETVVAMLAATSIGAVWSSCSPDFGEQGIIDRFGQIEPVLLFASDGYWYAGKRIDIAEKIRAVAERLPSLRATVFVDLLGGAPQAAAQCRDAVTFDAALDAWPAKEPVFLRLPFAHPLYILFSSGTTGIPKCIVHSAGGTLLQHLKEHRLHTGVRPGDRFFWFTTCGWMMWNWLVSALASGATLLLYDGSPLHPDGNVLFDYAQDEEATYFGTSPKFLDATRKAGGLPRVTHDLSSVQSILSTGSPLSPEAFEFVYDAVKADVHLASVSGGTDIIGGFVSAIPTRPVWSGEIQGPALGMAVDVWDEDGRPLARGKGELVCTSAFPSMPLMFWNDPDGAKYSAAYFERFDGVWCHGDFAEWTDNGGMIIHGRSDATLNPGGVRIGTSEIYNQVELIAEVREALCIGQEWEGDVRVVLFVRLADGVQLDAGLEKSIKAKIRGGTSPRHVPARVIAVADIPRTKSGKITELAVRDVVHGRAVKNTEALANPEALELFRNIPDLST